jgi:O-antigen/teichoic acid export membrane protein
MIYFTIAIILSKVATTLTQVVLGWVLSPADFGVFSAATALAGFLMVCREAGVRELLIQRGPAGYDDLIGPGFWLAFWYNVLVACIITAVAFPIARYMDSPPIAPILLVLAWALPIGALGGILAAAMRVRLMFRDFSSYMTTASLARQAATIALAFSGFGVMSMAWAAMLAAAVESTTAFLKLREKPWKKPAQVQRWWEILRESRWLMFASLANFAVDWGPFLMLPLVTMATKTVQGYFSFAWSITAQLGILLAWGMMLILTPVLARMNDDPQRQAGAVIRALRAVMMLGSVGCLALGAAMEPLEHFVWKGKWEQSVFPVLLLGVFFPWRITFGLTSALLQAQGRFKRYAVVTLFEGLGLTLFVTVAALIDPRPDMLAWGGGLWLAVSRLVICVIEFRRMGVSPRVTLGSTLPAWTIALLSAALAMAFDTFIVSPQLSQGGVGAQLPQRIDDLLRASLLGGLTVLLSLLGYRIVLRRHLEDALSIAPAKLQPLARKLLRMPAPPNQ